ncbi:chitin synthase 2 [Stagonosporopsis vannaccii]|nr:chitin synthase 2 [Stagonosporopsis vannaccii]
MSGGHSSSGIGDAIKKGVGMVHGTGEAIRGNFNAAVDQAGGDRIGVEKNAAIASHGADEIDHGYHRTGHTSHVGDAERERLNTTSTASTNYGSHSTNTGNKLDPRFDSDMDHRGTATGSTNLGSHTTNTANKLDPRFDSDADHRANPNSVVR